MIQSSAAPTRTALASPPVMTTLSDAPYTSSPESDLERRKRLRTVVAASLLGTTVEWYDFFLYATAASLVFNQKRR